MAGRPAGARWEGRDAGVVQGVLPGVLLHWTSELHPQKGAPPWQHPTTATKSGSESSPRRKRRKKRHWPKTSARPGSMPRNPERTARPSPVARRAGPPLRKAAARPPDGHGRGAARRLPGLSARACATRARRSRAWPDAPRPADGSGRPGTAPRRRAGRPRP